ncbi:hypothetical protein PoB_000712500 [Plakobranchus ocellatus]|uniref:Uncharacterized protein n=1 Tax=Plakobranchus ocellatus TaxID=259542 RepID=A0AAV3YDL0_9GAST|nr:hypothetical protein PoB_000712500 [Plakobranchus ocellatus]
MGLIPLKPQATVRLQAKGFSKKSYSHKQTGRVGTELYTSWLLIVVYFNASINIATAFSDTPASLRGCSSGIELDTFAFKSHYLCATKPFSEQRTLMLRQ